MKTWHEAFSRDAFSAPPQVRDCGGWRVEYMGFSGPAAGHPPLLCLGGAFQSRWSFRHVAERLLPLMPVVVVDLPGQGANAQEAQTLGFDDFADVLERFCAEEGLGQVVPLGLSYGSALAFAFAARHPQRVKKLILGGTSVQLRETVAATLRHGLSLIGEGQREGFATGAVMHLMNLSARAQTGVSDRLVQRMYEAIHALDEPSRRRYRVNTQRLLDYRMSGSPSVEALVYAGQYDSFTSAAECYQVARMIPGARFAIVANADHLVPLQRPDVELDLYRAFISGDRPLEEVPGLCALDRLPSNKRVYPRHHGAGTRLRIRPAGGGTVDAVLADACAGGLAFEAPQGYRGGTGTIEVELGDRVLLAHAYQAASPVRASVIMTSMPAQQKWEALIAGLPPMAPA